jgi:hypothetical protein
MFTKANGTLRWEHEVTFPVARKGDPAWVGTHAAFSGDWVVVLSGGRILTKLSITTGAEGWTWDFPIEGSYTNIFTNVGIDDARGKIVLMGYTTQFTASAVHMILDLEHMAPFSDLITTTSHTKVDNTLLVRRADGGGYAVVWYEFGRIRVVLLDLNGRETQTVDSIPPGPEGRRYRRIVDVGAGKDGYIVAELEDGSGAVVKINEAAELIAYFENSEQTKKGAPVYAGGVGLDASHTATFSRVAYSSKDKAWTQSTLAILPNGEVETRIDLTHLGPNDVVVHSVVRRSAGVPDIVYTTSTGAMAEYCFTCTEPGTRWIRHEGLADLADVHFVDLGKPETEDALEVMEEETFLGRLARHIVELKVGSSFSKFPPDNQDLPGFIVSAVFSSKPELSVINVADVPIKDELANLQKIIVAVTRSGQAFGISPKTGRVMWNTALGFFSQNGPELEVTHVFTTRNITEHGNPQLAVLATRTRMQQTATMGFHIDALTGKVAGDVHEDFDVPLGKEVFSGAAKKAFLLPFVNCCTKNRVVAVVDDEDQLHIFPKCKKIANEIEAMGSRILYSVLENEVEGTSLTGYAVAKQLDGMKFSTIELWTRPFHAQVVLDAVPLTPSVTASFGRALGDKSVLYKYLNPHLQVITSLSPLKAIGHVMVVDSTTGATVYAAEIPHVVGDTIRAVMVENWLVFAWLERVPGATEGWRLSSVELYDNTAKSAGASTFAETPDISSISHTYILQTSVSALAFTTSKFGVATKDLVFVNDLGQVAFLPYRMLDPRRPVGKPTKAEQEEMLVPYGPLLPDPPSAVVSHKYPLMGISRLTAGATVLESTSLLLASGLDMFATAAIQPSGTFDTLGTGFNKFQLVGTLAVLAAGVLVAKPAVQRKTLREKWF